MYVFTAYWAQVYIRIYGCVCVCLCVCVCVCISPNMDRTHSILNSFKKANPPNGLLNLINRIVHGYNNHAHPHACAYPMRAHSRYALTLTLSHPQWMQSHTHIHIHTQNHARSHLDSILRIKHTFSHRDPWAGPISHTQHLLPISIHINNDVDTRNRETVS